MEYLVTQLDSYESATQKEPKAKRAFIQALYQITALSAAINELVKDKPSFDAHFEKCVTSKAKFNKDMANLALALNEAKSFMDIVRNERKRGRQRHQKYMLAVVGHLAIP